MSYYFLANIKIQNPSEYQKYLDKADDVFRKYNGRYLAVDESPVLLEGKWDYTRSVLIEFRSKEEFDNWYHSDDYLGILKHRLKSADCDSILIKGLP